MTWLGVTSCTMPAGCAVEVVVETGAWAQPLATQVVVMGGGPTVGVIRSSTVAVLMVQGAAWSENLRPPNPNAT
jgi:lipid-binding SYLF domain-containing protein